MEEKKVLGIIFVLLLLIALFKYSSVHKEEISIPENCGESSLNPNCFCTSEEVKQEYMSGEETFYKCV